MFFFDYETNENIINICLKKPFKLQRSNELLLVNNTFWNVSLKNKSDISGKLP